MRLRRIRSLSVVLLILVALVSPAPGSATTPTEKSPSATASPPERPVVARVFFRDRTDLNRLARDLDVWEVNRQGGYLVALLHPAEYLALE